MPQPVVMALSDTAIHRIVSELAPRAIQSGRGVLVTDDLEQVERSELRVAFVSRDLPAIIQAMAEFSVNGILVPSDVTAAHLTAIGNGSRVYSHFGVDDLDVEPTGFRAVAAAAQSRTLEAAADRAGYSPRQLHRILHHLELSADLREGFRWSILAPLFPTDSTGGTT